MGVLLQANYRQTAGKTVPCPRDGHPTIPWWYDHIAMQARELARAGITAVLLPPVLKTASGIASNADGYGVYDDYDIGNKLQVGDYATRFGDREQLQRCIAILHANNIDVYIDTVPHQRYGGRAGVYRYLGADGKRLNGRFAKHPTCFFPAVPRDPIAGPVADDFSFGDELCPINAVPKNYVMNGLVDAGDWLTRSLDVQGYRIDDVKGMAVQFVDTWLNSKAMRGKLGIGEYYDGNPDTLNWYVWDSGLHGRSMVFDFALHFKLQYMCNNTSRWDMRQLQNAGLNRRSPLNAVTFVENPDTDTDGFATVIWNKILAYLYILTAEGYPCIYYKDYSEDAGCYGLKPAIDNLIWIHENLAFGNTFTRWADYQAYVFERTGYPNLLVGMNNDLYHGWRQLTVATNFGANVQLHDYSGHADDVWTDQFGNVTISIPPNDNGYGYVCYSRPGYAQPFQPTARPTTQTVFGAADLDIPPLGPDQPVTLPRIWCQAGSKVTVHVDTEDAVKPSLTISDKTDTALTDGAVKHTGWHVITLGKVALPIAGTGNFTATITYMAPPILSTAELAE